MRIIKCIENKGVRKTLMTITNWNIEKLVGYKPITTFYTDFSIADHYGKNAIVDTYKRSLKSAIFMGYKELTELVMVLNWKIWEHYEKNESYAQLYNLLYENAEEYATANLQGEELKYFYRTTD